MPWEWLVFSALISYKPLSSRTGRRASAPELWARNSSRGSEARTVQGKPALRPAGLPRPGGAAGTGGRNRDPSHSPLQQRGQRVISTGTGRTPVCHRTVGTACPAGNTTLQGSLPRGTEGEAPLGHGSRSVLFTHRPGQACTGTYLTLRTGCFSTYTGNKE